MAKKRKSVIADDLLDPEKNPEFNPEAIPVKPDENVDESDVVYDDSDEYDSTSYEIPIPGEGP